MWTPADIQLSPLCHNIVEKAVPVTPDCLRQRRQDVDHDMSSLRQGESAVNFWGAKRADLLPLLFCIP